MADEKFYEQKLTNEFIESLTTTQNVKNFIQAADKQTTLVGTITTKLERLIGIGASEARTYINLYIGQFRPGNGCRIV